MESKNMHYAYNKEYFDQILGKKEKVFECNDYIYNFRISEDASFYVNELEDSLKSISGSEFSLYTIYPGLMIGSGYPHNSGEPETIVGGFSFDQISGLPTLPGSSLKGILRSCFEEGEGKKEMIEALLGKNEAFSKEEYAAFIKNCFEENDIYLGAYPVIKKDEKIFASEHITPHKEPLKDPIPLGMLKVKPGIEYKYMFALKDFSVKGQVLVSASEKLALFKELILLFGAGAKTNVGFGQFSETKPVVVQARNNQHVNTTSEETMKVKITREDDEKLYYMSGKFERFIFKKFVPNKKVGDEVVLIKSTNKDGKPIWKAIKE